MCSYWCLFNYVVVVFRLLSTLGDLKSVPFRRVLRGLDLPVKY